MAAIFYPLEGTYVQAESVQGIFAGAKLRLFQSGLVTPGVSTARSEYVTAEATYSGYTAGGVSVPDFLAPILAPEGGYSITMPQIQFEVTGATGNVIGGFWIEAGSTPFTLLLVCVFDAPYPMQTIGQGLPVGVRLVQPSGF